MNRRARYEGPSAGARRPARPPTVKKTHSVQSPSTDVLGPEVLGGRFSSNTLWQDSRPDWVAAAAGDGAAARRHAGSAAGDAERTRPCRWARPESSPCGDTRREPETDKTAAGAAAGGGGLTRTGWDLRLEWTTRTENVPWPRQAGLKPSEDCRDHCGRSKGPAKEMSSSSTRYDRKNAIMHLIYRAGTRVSITVDGELKKETL